MMFCLSITQRWTTMNKHKALFPTSYRRVRKDTVVVNTVLPYYCYYVPLFIYLHATWECPLCILFPCTLYPAFVVRGVQLAYTVRVTAIWRSRLNRIMHWYQQVRTFLLSYTNAPFCIFWLRQGITLTALGKHTDAHISKLYKQVGIFIRKCC